MTFFEGGFEIVQLFYFLQEIIMKYIYENSTTTNFLYAKKVIGSLIDQLAAQLEWARCSSMTDNMTEHWNSNNDSFFIYLYFSKTTALRTKLPCEWSMGWWQEACGKDVCGLCVPPVLSQIEKLSVKTFHHWLALLSWPSLAAAANCMVC